MEQLNITLPSERSERVSFLRALLHKETSILINSEIRKAIKDALNSKEGKLVLAELKSNIPAQIEWDYYFESDDEGGTTPYIDYIGVSGNDVNEELLEFGYVINASWGEYETCLKEVIKDILNDFKDDLYDLEITSIDLEDNE